MLAPAVTRRLIREFAGRHEPHPGLARELAGVTPREREVLRLVARGLPNLVIAEHLGLSVATVKTHVRRLLAKLHAHDRAQMVVIAYETGVVTAGGNLPSAGRRLTGWDGGPEGDSPAVRRLRARLPPFRRPRPAGLRRRHRKPGGRGGDRGQLTGRRAEGPATGRGAHAGAIRPRWRRPGPQSVLRVGGHWPQSRAG